MPVKLSIVTAVYNAEKFIGHMIESVINQPHKPELLIINDGSTDMTQNICEMYSNKYPSIRVIKTENKGAGAARNIGIRNAKGEYILFLDADDLLLYESINNSFIELLNECFYKGVDIISTARSRIDLNLTDKPVITRPQAVDEIVSHMPNLEFWTCIYRKEYLLQKGISFFEYKEQDIESAFRWRAFSATKNVVVNPAYSFYLQRNNPISNVHTWNYYRLYRIKATVYHTLVLECKENINLHDDIPFLQYLMIDSLYGYVKCTRKHGMEFVPEVKSTIKCLEEFFRCREKGVHLSLPIHFVNYKKVIKYFYKTLYLNLFLHCNSLINATKKCEGGVTHKSLPFEIEHWDIIRKRWMKVSEYIHKICASITDEMYY